ncbi:hypothetical protein BDN71DRAFT_1509100 [Pleurotus eryngii]|uniref:Uncharacterized protein n=1 Tax=Pleurotus eryngii TaxID=5323 RepID=A0A9P5ZR02_PLEER|nr:hypothetical protein BDN71DRAFT_1509100 [Pleurotus eryngii]
MHIKILLDKQHFFRWLEPLFPSSTPPPQQIQHIAPPQAPPPSPRAPSRALTPLPPGNDPSLRPTNPTLMPKSRDSSGSDINMEPIVGDIREDDETEGGNGRKDQETGGGSGSDSNETSSGIGGDSNKTLQKRKNPFDKGGQADGPSTTKRTRSSAQNEQGKGGPTNKKAKSKSTTMVPKSLSEKPAGSQQDGREGRMSQKHYADQEAKIKMPCLVGTSTTKKLWALLQQKGDPSASRPINWSDMLDSINKKVLDSEEYEAF